MDNKILQLFSQLVLTRTNLMGTLLGGTQRDSITKVDKNKSRFKDGEVMYMFGGLSLDVNEFVGYCPENFIESF